MASSIEKKTRFLVVVLFALFVVSLSADCPTLEFFSGVQTTCFQFPDAPHDEHFLRVQTKNMADYTLTDDPDGFFVDIHFNTPTVDNIVVSDPSKYSPNEVVGVALDGVPIYSGLVEVGVDALAPDPTSGLSAVELDQCGGSYSSVGTLVGGNVAMRYHYRALPACILDTSDTVNKRKTLVNDVHELLDGFEGFNGANVIGYSLTGYPIYSPFDERGLLQDSLDNCNGKFNLSLSEDSFAPNNDEANSELYRRTSPGELSPYGYYTTPAFPYVVGCDGPGAHSVEELGLPADEQLMQNTASKLADCPAGYRRSELYANGCVPCPAGKFTVSSYTNNRPSCSMDCPVGHYCPEASVAPIKCPAGRYGASRNLQTEECSGACAAGYYCPIGSTKPNQNPCGNENFFCPIGSAVRTEVFPGYYTTSTTQISAGVEDRHSTKFTAELKDDVRTRTNQRLCPVGHYCVGGNIYPCAPGLFGAVEGLIHSNCSVEGSATSRAHTPLDFNSSVCPVGYYCPEASVRPIICPAGSYGDKEGLTTAGCSGLCERGHWCPAGSTSKFQNKCAPGIFGSTRGLKTANCNELCEDIVGVNDELVTTVTTTVDAIPESSLPIAQSQYCSPKQCRAGYFCPAGSTNADMLSCGVNESWYCPPGSSVPTPVSRGYYTVGLESRENHQQSPSDARHRIAQVECEPGYYCIDGVRYICPKGHYGEISGLYTADCSGECDAGYYCEEGSTSRIQYACKEPGVYCPRGSFTPTLVPDGYYSVGYNNSAMSTRSAIEPCPAGHYCISGIIRPCNAGRYSTNGSPSADCDGQCSAGYYCPVASTSKREIACPAGRYGDRVGMINSFCSGSCLEGHYCPSASTSAKQHECGHDAVYCPSGSGAPVPVDVGYYSTGGTAKTRVNQAECGVGSLTGTPPAGGVRVNLCPTRTV